MNTPSHNSQESGVTLLLAVFLMSGLVLISTTIAFLTVQQIRQSRAATYSEPAFAAAKAGAEQGIWQIKRSESSGISSCDDGSNNLPLSNATAAYCTSNGEATFNIKGSDPYIFYLYDPEDPNTDLDLSGMRDGGYHNMTVTLQSGKHNMNLSITRVSGDPVGTPVSYPVPVTLAVGGTKIINNLNGLQNGAPGEDDRMQVTLQCSSCAANDLTTMVVNTDVGMPTFPTVDSIGCAGVVTPDAGCAGTNSDQYNRRIQVTVPE
ncbi:MAG TPA: hypothetical protein VFX17_00245 [Patescibacteria group bacterium]|nr:hypothetical protein [Patescibacteria group bacterium]